MDTQEMINLIDELSKMSQKDINTVMAFAKFKVYLTENYGKKIDLSIISAFATLVSSVLDVEEVTE